MACTIPRFVKGWWFSPIFSSNKTDSNDITKILTKVMLKYLRYLEGLGLQGDMILAEGIRTGSAKVKARVKDAAYKVMSFF
jgi:hypothetical protein